MSFNNNDGVFCREYILNKSSIRVQGVACKLDNEWEIKISDSIGNVDNKSYIPASGVKSEKIEQWLDNNMADMSFSTNKEKEALDTK